MLEKRGDGSQAGHDSFDGMHRSDDAPTIGDPSEDLPF